MISIQRWNHKDQVCTKLDASILKEDAASLHSDADVVWIDLCAPTEEEERLVFEQFFRVHPLTFEDITRLRREPESPPHFPKVEEFSDYLFVIVNPCLLATKPKEAWTGTVTQLSVILTHRLLLTHHYDLVPGIRELETFLLKHQKQAERGPDFLFHLILDATVDQYVPAIDRIEETLDDLEERVFKQPSHQMLVQLMDIKRQIMKFRKSLVYEREVLARMTRGEFELIDAREIVYYRNVYDHLIRFHELLENSREMVTDLMQTHLSATSNKLNEVMKALTMISTIVLPMTLVAGVYGMNFDYMPETKWDYGYPFALAIMGLTGIGSFLFFRWRRWI